ncbi:LOW QUALITY PROTEIN: little elongation complex subunit 2 [Drosophila rhopaloa]|uniref:Little elongation complex subunit 2 C-terminal domain-containing protein n=1 Tax=Drosophila rhopaloa TaxID=1041015 RepID=A0ABM5J693_DRORH|nr:LOW QUALITY PROTEIN: little elongation complex subunit 2 [Drosophila rhopaloa]
MDKDPPLHQGNAIFRNQPSYKVFNKSFENVNDALYTFLNEVDPEVLRQELRETADVFKSFSRITALRDPRTEEVPGSPHCDHSGPGSGYSFPNPQELYSELNLKQQAACMRVLLSWQRSEPVDEEDFVVWQATEKKRCNEQQRVQKHIHDHEHGHREVIYAPMKSLVAVYRKWYELNVKKLLKAYPNESYVTFSGLPQLSQCKSLNSQTASIEHVELERILGRVRLWPEVEVRQKALRTLRVRLERYSIRETYEPAKLLRDEEKELELEAGNIFVLPLDSLLMLLTSGSYIDLPTEMFVSLKASPNSNHKCMEFQSPFPARNCGWHTNSLVLKRAYEAFVSQPGEAKWLDFGPNGSVKEVLEKPTYKMPSINLQMEYKPQAIDQQSFDIVDGSTNTALVSWSLRCKGEGEQNKEFQVFSTLPIPAVRDSKDKKPLGCHFIKLENKPDCGCEIMSKYELISAWLQLKLLQAEMGHCTRISLRDFEPMMEEKLTLISLEQQLHDYYNTSMPQLLSNLYEFLKLLDTVPGGEYLLRYSPKYKDKFLLCNATKEAPAQSFQLHQLLTETSPSDQIFLTQSSYLPISPTLCGRLHTELQLLPCAFPAKADGKAIHRRNAAIAKPEPAARAPGRRPRGAPGRRPVKKWTEAQTQDFRRKCKYEQKNRARARKKAAANAEKVQLDKIMSL